MYDLTKADSSAMQSSANSAVVHSQQNPSLVKEQQQERSRGAQEPQQGPSCRQYCSREQPFAVLGRAGATALPVGL